MTTKLDGVISTSIPGDSGNDGKRGAITHFASSEYTPSSPTIGNYFDASIENLCARVYCKSSISPRQMVGDYILYSTINETYLARIINISTTPISTETIDTWKNGDSYSSSTDIDLEIAYSDKIYPITTLDETIPNISIYNKDSVNYTQYVTTPSYSNSIKTFNIISKNDQPLGKYKIELEFITDLTSPNMDTMIADKFASVTTLRLYNAMNPQYYWPYEDLVRTMRGNFYNYDRKKNKSFTVKGVVPKEINFDHEYLDNFTLILKDYNDGVGELSYITDVNIPLQPICRVIQTINRNTSESYKYKCYAYIYIPNTDSTYTKELIQEIDINNLIN